MLKSHHCFADGLGLGTFFLSLCGEYDAAALPGTKPIPFWKNVMIYCLFPYIVLKSNIVMFSSPADSNSMKRGEPMTGRKNGAFSEDLDLPKMK